MKTNYFHAFSQLLCRRGKILFAVAALLTGLTACLTTRPEPGFVTLFDGQSLTGWIYLGKPGGEYFVTNGVIVCPANTMGNLVTEKEYSNFILRLEYKYDADGNNGVAIRAPLSHENLTYVGVEIQMLDDMAPKHRNLKAWQYNGSVYGIAAATNGAGKIGEWNSEEITCVGRHYYIVLNGRVIVDTDLNDVRDSETLQTHPGMLRERGHLGFLGHDNRFEFRNIRVQEIPVHSEDNTPPPGFTALFNGKDLGGWKGWVRGRPVHGTMTPEQLAAQARADRSMRQHWHVENGELAFDGHGDDLRTAKDYGDFEMLVDWKIPPKGDSGIYLRGIPEVQIWEPNTPQQSHPPDGSGGLYNNKTRSWHPLRIADRPVGEWNRFRILMTGDKVHVFLNDKLVVNDGTLKNYSDPDKPLYPFGPLELQNHGTPVWFKNIYVREIPRN